MFVKSKLTEVREGTKEKLPFVTVKFSHRLKMHLLIEKTFFAAFIVLNKCCPEISAALEKELHLRHQKFNKSHGTYLSKINTVG